MATVSRVSQVSHTNATGSGDWDHRLNRLLEDLQETIPPDSKLGNASEYRAFQMTQRTKVNDEPAQEVNEKWVEIGTPTVGGLTYSGGGGGGSGGGGSGFGGGSTRFGEKSVAFSDDVSSSSRFESSSSRDPQIQYLAPANTTTVLRSGPSSPVAFGTSGSGSGTSPKVERKEFYSKASYTTLIKGGVPELVPVIDGRPILDDTISPDFRSLQSSNTTSESTKRSYMSDMQSSSSSSRRIIAEPDPGPPLYASTPLSSSKTTRENREYSRELMTDRTRSVTPPPKVHEALKTPPMIRKILQQSQPHKHETTSQMSSLSSKTITQQTTASRPPPAIPIRDYEQPPSSSSAVKYYTSSTHTEHRERDISPVRKFPSPGSARPDTEPPKRLDELLRTFGDHSYSETHRYTSEGTHGAHKSIPHGPGTHPVQALRQVRIDDNVLQRQIEEESQLVHRKPETRPVAGPPVYFPPGQIFEKTHEEALATTQEKGKMKAKREYKEKEKMKSKHSEKGGGGAVPVPVCLPVCCAAPCVIM